MKSNARRWFKVVCLCEKQFEVFVSPLAFEHSQHRKFCSKSCANRRTIANTFNCTNCGTTFKRKGTKSSQRFCGKKCYTAHHNRVGLFEKFELGLISSRQTIKKILASLQKDCCEVCNLKEWNNKPISLQVDHIDGNAGNNLPSNLRLLCPNCHSQTSTWGSKNKGNGRKTRGIKPG